MEIIYQGKPMIQLLAIADEFWLDNANLRKYTLKVGITPTLVRVPQRRNKLCMCLTRRQARELRARLKLDGYQPRERKGR